MDNLPTQIFCWNFKLHQFRIWTNNLQTIKLINNIFISLKISKSIKRLGKNKENENYVQIRNQNVY